MVREYHGPIEKPGDACKPRKRWPPSALDTTSGHGSQRGGTALAAIIACCVAAPIARGAGTEPQWHSLGEDASGQMAAWVMLPAARSADADDPKKIDVLAH